MLSARYVLLIHYTIYLLDLIDTEYDVNSGILTNEEEYEVIMKSMRDAARLSHFLLSLLPLLSLSTCKSIFISDTVDETRIFPLISQLEAFPGHFPVGVRPE